MKMHFGKIDRAILYPPPALQVRSPPALQPGKGPRVPVVRSGALGLASSVGLIAMPVSRNTAVAVGTVDDVRTVSISKGTCEFSTLISISRM